jgi:hypothetical protein
MVGGAQAARAFHVLHDDVRIARDMPAEVAADQPRGIVVAAADAVADHDRYRLALVEIVVGMRRAARDQRKHKTSRQALSHCPLTQQVSRRRF